MLSEWRSARKELLAEEKRLTRQMDAVSAKRPNFSSHSFRANQIRPFRASYGSRLSNL